MVYELEEKKVIYDIPLCFDYDKMFDFGQSETLGNHVNTSVVDIEALHYKVMVMPNSHVINSHFEPSLQNDALHYKVLVPLGPHFVNFNSKKDVILLNKTPSMTHNSKFLTCGSNEVCTLSMKYLKSSHILLSRFHD